MIARYQSRSWVGDSILGGLGVLLLGLWTVVLAPSFWSLIPFFGFLGSLYLIGRTIWLQTIVYEVQDNGMLERRGAFVPVRRVNLKALERADLHYLGTLLRGARGKSGLFVLHLSDGETKMRIESKVDGFHGLSTTALKAFIEKGESISLATYDNADALDIDVGLKTDMISRPV